MATFVFPWSLGISDAKKKPAQPLPNINEVLEDDVKRAVAITRLFYAYRGWSMSQIYKLCGYQGRANREMLAGLWSKDEKVRPIGQEKAQRFYDALIKEVTLPERLALEAWEASGMFLTQDFEDQTFDISATAEPEKRHFVWLDGYVYLFSDGNGNFKIGYSNDPERRLKELLGKTIIPYDFHEVHRFKCESMVEAERRLHEKFAEKRHKGEWFTLTDDDVAWLCSIKCYTQEFGFEEVEPKS